MSSLKNSVKPSTSVLQSTRILDQLRERIRYMHYGHKTEKACIYWIRFFIRWRATQPGGMRHPREMGVADVEAFLSEVFAELKTTALQTPRRSNFEHVCNV
jgi:hypothetical protein